MLSEKLENLQKEFIVWRSSGRDGVKIPDCLRLRAVELLSDHKPGEIQKALSISSNMLCNWRREYRDESHFRMINLSSDKYALKLSNGNLSVEGELSLSDWQEALVLLK